MLVCTYIHIRLLNRMTERICTYRSLKKAYCLIMPF